jgi:hypothetical protein
VGDAVFVAATAAAARTAIGSTTVGDAVFVAATAAAARTAIGAVIGTDVQAYDADLTTLAANITAAGHALVDDASASAQRTTLGSTTVGDAVFVAASTAAARLALENRVLQVVSVDTGAVATGTTILPSDDTIPQNTEGNEYMTLAITPLVATSTLVIDVAVVASHSAANQASAVALFRDSTVGAIGAVEIDTETANYLNNFHFSVKAPANSTSLTTFKVRIGSNTAGTTTFNGRSTARLMGGIMSSSIRITELAA